MSHEKNNCECKSGNRTLVLLSKDFSDKFPELLGFSSNKDWKYLPDFGVVQVEIGKDRNWSSATEVLNFVRTIVTDTNRLGEMRAAWLKGKQPLAQQLVELVYNAEPFINFAPADASELFDILQERKIETWFQPVVEARSGKLWGYECLMRGRRRDGSLVGALQMLDWAHQENLTFMLDRVCRETHLENAGKMSAGADCKFLINFLPTAIYQPEFCLQTSMAAARRSGISPRQIIFEVVETEKVADTAHLQRILQFYRDAGFGVALDDMGSGYAGLTLLADLQPDLIKIDREIVSKSVGSKFHRDICASLIRLGKENNLLVLAEGVETIEEKTVMDGLGIDLFQGYFFGKPAPQPSVVAPFSQTIRQNILQESLQHA